MGMLKKIYSDSLYTALSSTVLIARGIVILSILSNYLGATGYGVWITTLSVVGLLTSAFGMHMHGSLIRFGSQKSENQVYSDTYTLSLIFGLLVIGFFYAIRGFVSLGEFIGIPQKWYGLSLGTVASILVASNILYKLNISYPRSKGDVRVYELIRLSKVLLEVIAVGATVIYTRSLFLGLLSLLLVTSAYVVGSTIFIFYYYTIPLPRTQNMGQYLRYGLPMLPKELSGKLLTHSDKYLLIYFIGPAAVGVYSAAQAICKPILHFTVIFDSTLYPTISKAWDSSEYTAITDIYHSIFRFYTILAIPAIVGIIFLAQPLLTLITTKSIAHDGVHLVPIFIVGYYLKGYDNSIRYILTSAERTDIIGGSAVLVVTVNVIINILLIPRYGILGAAIATSLSHILLLIIIMYYSQLEIQIRLPWGTAARSIIATGIMSLILYSIGLGSSPIKNVFVLPIVGSAAYFATMIILGEFSKSEIGIVINYIK